MWNNQIALLPIFFIVTIFVGYGNVLKKTRNKTVDQIFNQEIPTYLINLPLNIDIFAHTDYSQNANGTLKFVEFIKYQKYVSMKNC